MVGGGYECLLKETPEDVQRKYQRMQQVNVIYNVHESTKADVQEGDRVAKRTKTAQTGSRGCALSKGSSDLDARTVLPFIATWVVSAIAGVSVGVAALWDSGATKVYGSEVWFQYLIKQKAVVCSQVYASPRKVGGSCRGTSWILG